VGGTRVIADNLINMGRWLAQHRQSPLAPEVSFSGSAILHRKVASEDTKLLKGFDPFEQLLVIRRGLQLLLVFPPPQPPQASHSAGMLGGQIAPTNTGARHSKNAFHTLLVR